MEVNHQKPFRVAIIRPPLKSSRATYEPSLPRVWPPLELLNCAAIAMKEGLEVLFIDAVATGESVPDIVDKARSYDMALLTSSSLDAWQCPSRSLEGFIETVKQLSAYTRTVISGFHATASTGKMLRLTKAWAAICGEPEEAFHSLINGSIPGETAGTAVWNGKLVKGPAALPVPLDDIPEIPWELIDSPWPYSYPPLGSPFALLETSRGCPSRCRFCAQRVMYGEGLRFRSPENTAAQVKDLLNRGIKNIYFIDLDFLSSPAHAMAVCDEIIANNLHKELNFSIQCRPERLSTEIVKKLNECGCSLIHVGMESLSSKVMKQTGKPVNMSKALAGMKSALTSGITPACFFMYGLPGEDLKARLITLFRAMTLPCDLATFHIAVPYPGTKLIHRDYAGETPAMKALVRISTFLFYLWPPRFIRNIRRLNPENIGIMARMLGIIP